MNKNEAVRKRIDVARKELDDADDELAHLLNQMRVAPRAEKTTVSRVVEDALGKLRAARAHLSVLEQQLARDDE